MPRQARADYPGALHHVTVRGARSRDVFGARRDFDHLLGILGEACARYRLVLHGHVLMPDHFHLLAETPLGNLSQIMHYISTAYSVYRGRTGAGRSFAGRFRSILVEKESYLVPLHRYVHLNPVRAGIVRRPEDYEWSSFRAFVEDGTTCCTTDWVLGQFSSESALARREYRKFVEAAAGVRLPSPFDDMVEGFVLGRDEFVRRVRQLMLGSVTTESGPEGRSLEVVLNAAAAAAGCSPESIRRRRRGSAARLLAVYLARKHSLLSNRRIGTFFGIGESAVTHAVNAFSHRVAESPDLRAMLSRAENRLGA